MTRSWPALWVACVLSCGSPSGAAPDTGSRLQPGDHDLRLHVGDRERSYLLHLPPQVRDGPDLPLMLAFHGGGGRASGFRDYAGLDAVSDREGFIVAYPNGTGRLGRRLLTWNAGGCCGFAKRHDVDDVGFARALVTELMRRLPIDRARVYATGHSNGAMMVYRLAAQASDLVAAIVPVAGAMMLDETPPPRDVPVLHIHSVDDPRALYLGGPGPRFPFTTHRVSHPPVEVELGRWVDANGCRRPPLVIDTRHDPETGHTATLLRFGPCESGSPVELWRLRGAGHGWPGAQTQLPERLVGPHTSIIDGAEEAWRFVSRFRRNGDALE